MDFYKKMIETELKQMFYWMACATESTKNGESALGALMNAARNASKVNEYRARIDAADLERGTNTAIDWEKLTDWAIKQARAEIEQENAKNAE